MEGIMFEGILLESILYPIICVGGLALVFGVILGFSAKKLAVKANPAVEKIIKVLPGANCGGCGFPGCTVFANALFRAKRTIAAARPAALTPLRKSRKRWELTRLPQAEKSRLLNVREPTKI